MKTQFKSLSNLFFEIENETLEWLYQEKKNEIEIIIHNFYSDITNSKYGYPTKTAQKKPFTEEAIIDLIEKNVTKKNRKKNVPFICLSHDVDYIYPNLVQTLKRFFGRFDFKINLNREAYLDSLEKYLTIDQKYGKTTLFAALPQARPKSLPKKFKQWLIDPSYSEKDDEFKRFKDIIHKFDVDMGIHGSLYSLEQNFFKQEVKALEQATEKKIELSRQHWLKLDSMRDLSKIKNAGINIDSTLGWNGTLGYRCGMARPYPIVLPSGGQIWEIPMLLMDGILFDVLGLSESDVISHSKAILDEVFEVGGGTSLNWHERTFADDYKWGNAYQTILGYAHQKGFKFLSFSEAVSLYE